MYREVALNCIRFLDYKSLEEVDRLTIAEYKLLMEGVRLKEIDKDYRNHLQAFLNFSVRSERKAGKILDPYGIALLSNIINRYN